LIRAVIILALLLLGAASGEAAAPQLVDLALAEVADRLVTLSDVALSRALGLYGLAPTDGPITPAELERYLEAQLAIREAVQLAIDVSADDVQRVWDSRGGAALGAWLDCIGVDPAWARRLIEADLRAQRFVDLRFQAFAFVSDADVDAALGPGPHDETARTATRERLRADMVARALATWRARARERTPIRYLTGGESGPWPAPFSRRTPETERC
jgi:hypothetical protein